MKNFTCKSILLFPLLLIAVFSYSQTSWVGLTSTSWSTASNWTNGVPNAATDAILGDASFTGPNQPTVNATSSCKSLTLGGAVATTLLSNKNLTVSGNVLIQANGTLSHGNSSLTITGNWTNNNTYLYTSTGAKVVFNGINQSVNGPSVTTFRKLTVNAGCVLTLNINITTDNILSVSGTINPNTPTTYTVTPSSMTVTATGKILVYAATFAGNYSINPTLNAGSTVEYGSSSVNQTVSSSLTYTNLIVNGSSTKLLTANLPSLRSNTASEGNIFVKQGVFDLQSFTANRGTSTAGGNFEVYNGASLKIGGTNTFPTNYAAKSLQLASTVQYYGNNQTVLAVTYGNLILSGTSGAITKTMPATAFIIDGDFSSILGTGTSIAFTAASAISFNGNVSIGASTTFNAASFTHIADGNWVNNGTFTGSTSTISITGAGSVISGTGTHNFNNLSITVSAITAAATSNLNLSGNLATTGAGQFTHLAGGTLTMSGAAKTITGTDVILSNFTVSGSVSTTENLLITGNLAVSGTFASTIGTVIMNGAAKTITGAGTISFYSFEAAGSLSATATFSISGSLDVSGSITATAGTATFTSTSNLNGTANLFNVTLNGTSLTLSTNSVLGIASSFTITAGTLNVTTNVPNTVNFNGSGAQTVNAITYHHLNLSTGNTKTAGGAITTNGNITINSSVTFAASSFTHQVYGNWVNSGVFTAGTSTVQFRGGANKSITGATTFNILTVNKTASTNTITLNNSVSAPTVNMVLGTMLTGANTITITSSRTGNGIILGTITRTHSFATLISYAFEGPDNSIYFTAATGVTSVTVNVAIGTIGDFPNGGSINRVYTITVPAGTYVATLRLHYEDAELNGNGESLMQLWRYNGTVWGGAGKSANSTTSNYVEQVGLTNITNRWTCSEDAGVVRWNGLVSSAWNLAANWTIVSGSPALPPASNDIVQIGTAAFTNDPTITTTVGIKSIVFGSTQAANLTIGAGGSLTTSGNINGNWTANAVHTINAGNQVVTVNGDLTLSNGTASRAINLNIGTGTVAVNGSITQSGGANVTFSAAGTLDIKTDYLYSSGTFTAGTGLVQYTGTGSQLVAPLAYNNLTVNKLTGIALLNTAATASGNLNVISGELNANANLTISGNITISSGAIFAGDAVQINAAGNWTINGFFNAGTGTVNINGTGTQTISATTFNNLIVNKSSGSANLTGNSVITGNLTLLAGIMDFSTYNCNRISPGGVLTIANGSNLYVGGANNFPANFSVNSLGATSTVSYNGSAAQSVRGISYGNLTFINGGVNVKTLLASATVNGDITVNSGATLHSGGFTVTLLGNWINNGSFTASTGTIVFNGTSKTITGNTTFNRITVNGSYSISTYNTVYNGLINVTSTGNYNAGSGVATVNGDLINSGTLVSSGTTTFTGTTVQTLRLINALSSTSTGIVNFNGNVPPVLNSTSSPNFATVNINNTGGVNPSITWNIFVAMNVNAGASFNGGISTHNIYGNFTNAGTTTSTGTLNFLPSTAKSINFGSSGFSSTGTLNFGGSGLVTMSGIAGSLNNVVISNTNAAGVTPSSDWNMNGKFSINSDAVFNAGSYTYTVADDIESDGTLNGGTSTFIMTSFTGELTGSPNTVFYHFTIGTSAIVTANSDFSVAGNYTNNGTYDGAIGNLVMTGSNAATIGGTPVLNSLAQLIIAKTGGGVVTMNVALTNVFLLYIQSGTLFTSTYGITQDVSGGFLIIDNTATLKIGGTNSLPAFSGYSLDANSNVDYAGTTQAIANAAVYGNLWITAAGNKTAIVPFTTLGNFTLSAGTFTSAITVTHFIGGNWLMSGGTFTNTNITIQMNGAAGQSISSTGNFRNLVINKTTGLVTLASHVTVSDILTLTSGKISLLGYNLIIPTTATITGANSSKYVIAEGAGLLIMQVTASGTKTFPVGTTADYVPATIALTAGSTSDNFRVRVQNYVLSKGTSGNVLTHFAVNNTWFISEETAGAADATVTLQWPLSLELLGFDRIQARVSQSSGSFYQFGPNSPGAGSNPYTSNKANVTTFFAFAVLNNVVVLDVSWLNISGENKNGDNHIKWNVANERASNDYSVEYSTNGINFNTVGNVAGKGSITSSNSYSFIHQQVFVPVSFYRIKQIDAEKSYTYSPVIKIKNADAGQIENVKISPNPVTSYANLTIQSVVNTKMNMLIYDAAGKKISEQLISLRSGANVVPLNFTGLNSGFYFVKLLDENNTEQVIRVLKK